MFSARVRAHEMPDDDITRVVTCLRSRSKVRTYRNLRTAVSDFLLARPRAAGASVAQHPRPDTAFRLVHALRVDPPDASDEDFLLTTKLRWETSTNY